MSDETTKDAFHRGQFHLIQPKKGAHRAGIDAMLLAACVPENGALKIADFGAGAGAVGLAIASRCTQAKVTLIERNQRMFNCAQESLGLKENAHLTERVSLLATDISRLPTEDAPTNHFDWVVMNPPFNERSDRESPHADRAEAHVADDELFEIWVKKAATVLHAKGQIGIIARPSSLMVILNAMDRRFGGLRMTAVHARAEDTALRVLLTGTKGSKKRLEIGPRIVLHGPTGHAFTEEAQAIVNGATSLT
ncbi:MAG: methyltransferase [Pseudomonadota bacterium]